MEELGTLLPELLTKTIIAVITSLSHNWIPLSLAIITAAIFQAHVDVERFQQTLRRRAKVSILASVIFGAFTPFCACGTMAVVIGMLTTTVPWGPIMAFLTSSPLMSPDGFIMIAGIIGFKFAVALALASVAIGLGSGYLTHMIETKSDFLKDQTRFSDVSRVKTGCSCDATPQNSGCGCQSVVKACCFNAGQTPVKAKRQNIYRDFWRKWKVSEIWKSVLDLGLKQILPNFALFVAIGFLANYFIPTSVIMGLFSSKNVFAIPLASLIGLPLYITTESGIPLINSLMAEGASGGAMLGFIITGSATSAWVIAGISVFMKKKIIGLYILYILLGGILCGYLYDLIVAMGI